MEFEPEPPQTPDYYADLQLSYTATNLEIKRAHHALAKKYHPDKLGLGVIVDAHEFRKIRHAFEFLRDPTKRATYDIKYPKLRQAWDQYHVEQELHKRREEAKKAEELAQRRTEAEARRAFEKAEEERLARAERARALKKAEERNARRRAEEARLAREKEELERQRQLREAQAERRSREAAQRAREQQEIAARERLRREKEKEAEKRSEETARKARQERQAAAEERLRDMLREEKDAARRMNWASLRGAAELRGVEKAQPGTPKPQACQHPQMDWLRKKGKADCGICGALCSKFAFMCAQCDILACKSCKDKYMFAR